MTTLEDCKQALTQLQAVEPNSGNQQQAAAIVSTVKTALHSLSQVHHYLQQSLLLAANVTSWPLSLHNACPAKSCTFSCYAELARGGAQR